MAGRIMDFIARGTVALVDASRRLQALQARLTAGEVKDAVEHFEPYGYTSNPLAGAEAILAFVGGDRSHCVALIVADRRYRPTELQPGEVCLFTDEGDEIRFKRGRIISVIAGAKVDVTAPEAAFHCSAKVTLDTPLVHALGDFKADGQVSDAAGSMQAMRDVHNVHDHTENDAGGPTDPPNQRM
ncbi:phage baseplate assembly protein V [Castellaniella sp. UC4442_H9]